ncbi:MAG: class I SAM-dependent methyltransferase [Terriglobia bacterium]
MVIDRAAQGRGARAGCGAAACEYLDGQGKPAFAEACRKILDIGCGKGGALLEANLPPGAFVVGADMNLDELKTCRLKLPAVHVVCASGEHLPFRTEVFDAYLARSAWPYMNLVKGSEEAYRVLSPEGSLWVTARNPAYAFAAWLRSVRLRWAHGVVFNGYVLLNGLLFHLTGRIFRFPFKWWGMSRYESFQTRRSLLGLLRGAGFRGIRIVRGGFFVITAVK